MAGNGTRKGRSQPHFIRMKKSYIFPCLFLICSSIWDVGAQEWEPVVNFPNSDINNRYVLELFPDTALDRLYIGGQFLTINNDTFGNIVAYDGNQLHNILDGIGACWNGGCAGVVSIIRYRENIIASLVRSATYESDIQVIGIGGWNGEQWHPLDGGIASDYLPFVQQYFPATAYDFCIADNTLYVAGSIHIIDSMPACALGAWDGTQWHTYMQEPGPGEFVLANSIAKYKGSIYLGGNILLHINGEEVRDLTRYDGTSWQKVGEVLQGFNTNLRDLEVFQDKLYVAGYFTQADGNPGNSIMSWDGEQWNDLGGGVCGYGIIDDLFVYKDKLYVAGLFDCIGGIEAHNVAVWDGAKWCSIGNSTFNRAVNTIAVWRDTVYAGGQFYEIDGQSVRFLARYVGDAGQQNCSIVSVASPGVVSGASLSVSPNPAHTRMTISVSGAGAALHYEVFDLLGQVYWSYNSCSEKKEIPVADWPAGWYVVRAIGAGGAVSKVFVKR